MQTTDRIVTSTLKFFKNHLTKKCIFFKLQTFAGSFAVHYYTEAHDFKLWQ
jgi:hypothetical protein